MNTALRKEIALHILKSFGFFSNDLSYKGFIEPLNSDKFLLNKKIVFEAEDEEKQERSVWAASAKVNSSVVKILAADLNDGYAEYVLAIQLDSYPPCVVQSSLEEEDTGSFAFKVENKWVDAGSLMQAKILVGVESLSELYVKWEKLSNFAELYGLIIEFLNKNVDQ